MPAGTGGGEDNDGPAGAGVPDMAQSERVPRVPLDEEDDRDAKSPEVEDRERDAKPREGKEEALRFMVVAVIHGGMGMMRAVGTRNYAAVFCFRSACRRTMAKVSNGPAMDDAVSGDVSTMAKIINTFQTSDEEEIQEKRSLAIKRNSEVLRCMAEDGDQMKNALNKLFQQTILASQSLTWPKRG
ncbi:hypothetical protein EJB05_27921, partial [Eragrostis curvula]